ncbi:hypothetical protein D1872_282990 [compost metagenome]
MIDIVLFRRISPDTSVLQDKMIHIVADKIEILPLARLTPQQREAFQHNAVIIGPLSAVAFIFI